MSLAQERMVFLRSVKMDRALSPYPTPTLPSAIFAYFASDLVGLLDRGIQCLWRLGRC